MKKLTNLIFISVIFLGVSVTSANAQMMMGGFSNSAADWNEVVEHTLREEKDGKELWDKFQAKEVACADFDDEQFGVLGEYFMGLMLASYRAEGSGTGMGDSHAAMNVMMIQMHGEEGEEQIHIVMGKRLSGCDTSAVASGISGGWMPMMNIMNFGFGPFGGFGWIFMILWWVLIIAGIAALIKWFINQSRGAREHEKSSFEILKARYARGEINKQEFEEKKKDLI